MDFNFDTGTIYGGLQTLDVTTLPPLGGQLGVLTITGSGALTLPKGTTVQEPLSPVGGMFRYNTDFNGLEYFDSITWQQLSFASGAVSSFKLDDLSAVPIYTTSPTVSTTGAIAATMTLSTQSANSIFAGPATGLPAQPGFRSLVALDIPPVTNIASGATGDIVYQSAANTTTFLTPGATGTVVTSNGPGVAPSYTAVVNSFSTGSSGLTVNASTGNVNVNGGQLVVGYGGTGQSTLTLNGVVLGNGSSPVNVTAAGVQYNVLTVDALGVPVFGTLNLAQAGTAVTGILPLANGGTNNATAGSNGSIIYNNGTQIVNSAVGTNNQALLSSGAGAPGWLDVTSTVTTNQILQGNGSGAFTANGGTFVGSPTYSGATLQGTVTNATDATTKAYVDAAVAKLNVHGAVETTDTAAEITGAVGLAYTAGIAGSAPDTGTGVGAFLSGTGLIPLIGGYNVATAGIGTRVLIKQFTNVTAPTYIVNGIYQLTDDGSISGTWKLTRTSDYNNSTYGDVHAGDYVYVSEGSAAGTGWTQTSIGTQTPGDITKIGTDPIIFTQFSGAGTYTAGAGLALTGTVFSAKTDSTTTYVNGSNQIAVLSSATVDQVLLSNGSGNTAFWGAIPLNNSNAVTDVLGTSNGGTGLNTSTATNGQLLIGDGTGFTLSTLTPGTGIGVANGAGTITISNTGVTTFAGGTTGLTPASATAGAITLAGTLVVGNGGTGVTSLTTNGVMYGGATVGVTAAGATGEILVGNTGFAPSWTTLTGVAVTSFQTSLSGLTPSIATSGAVTLAGTLGISSGGTGQTTAVTAFDALAPTTTLGDLIYNNGTSNVRLPIGTAGQVLTVVTGEPTWETPPPTGVTSFQTSLSGLTPSVATTGAVTLAGTLGMSSGGTGLSTLGTANQFLSMNAGATALEYKTISAGTGISVTPGVGVLTIANTGVTSVGFSDLSTAPIYTVSGSPVTTTGTLSITLASQTANTVFAAPNGSSGQPSFRALTLTDLGTALQLYTENPSTPTTPVASGANAVAIGSGAVASATGSFAEGFGADARIYGQKAYANGSFAVAGDAQHGVYVLRTTFSTSNAFFELFLDGAGASQRLVLPNNSLFTFDILVAGVRTDGTSQGAGYRFVGVAKKDGAGTIAFVGTPSKTILGETIAQWDARITADTVTDSIKVETRGPNTGTVPINWVATVMTTEVTF